MRRSRLLNGAGAMRAPAIFRDGAMLRTLIRRLLPILIPLLLKRIFRR